MQMRVDQLAQRDQPVTVYFADQRVGVCLVNPVERGYLPVGDDPKGSILRIAGVSHIEREAVFLIVLIHELGSRTPIIGDQTTANQRETGGGQQRRVERSSQPLRQPADEMFLILCLTHLDLYGVAALFGEDDMGADSVADESVLSAGLRWWGRDVVRDPASHRSGDQQNGGRRCPHPAA